MRTLRLVLSALLVAAVPAAAALVPTDAQASVSIAVGFDALVKDADAVVVVTPQEHTSVWEEGRITTYTRVKVEQGVAGDVGGPDGWVRTLGGVVGKIGQLVDGEPVFVAGKPSLVFLRKFKTGGTFEVSARAQGQYPIVVDDVKKVKMVVRSSAVGVLFPPKPAAAAKVEPGQVGTQSVTTDSPQKIRLAQEVIQDRPLDEVTREIAAAYKRLHPVPGK